MHPENLNLILLLALIKPKDGPNNMPSRYSEIENIVNSEELLIMQLMTFEYYFSRYFVLLHHIEFHSLFFYL
jgi:hypothetical protein